MGSFCKVADFILYLLIRKFDGNRAQPLKRLFKNSTPRHKEVHWRITTDVIWVKSKVCSVTSEPTQSSSKRVSSLQDSSVLLSSEW